MTLYSKDEKGSFDDSSSTSDLSHLNGKFSRDDILVCGVRGKIYGISKKNGHRIWRAEFPRAGTGFFNTGSMGGIVSVFVTDTDKVIIGANGKVACLDLLTGRVNWSTKSEITGSEEMAIACTPSRALRPQVGTNNDETMEEPPSYAHPSEQQQIVIGASYGKCIGIDLTTGKKLWMYNCPDGGYNLPSVIVEPASAANPHDEQVVYVGCGRHVYCLVARTGKSIWHQKISKAVMGLNYITLATAWSSRLAAESHTSFNSNPSAQVYDAIRRRQSSAAGAGSAGASGGGGGC